MLDRIIDIISKSNCQIIQLDLTHYKNELNSTSLKRLQKALELNKSIRKIIWPKDISADTQQIDADLQKKFKTSIPGSVVINQYKNTPFFHQIIEKNADVYANTNKIAVVNVDAKTINYKQLNVQANQLAYHLSKVLNLPKGTKLGVLLNRSVHYIISIIACMKAGFIFVPIDTGSEKVSDDRLDHYLAQCDAKYVLTENGQVNRVNKLSTKPKLLLVADILCDEKIINTSEAKDNPSVQIQPTDISYIYFSSGSTGDPKGIRIEYGGLLNRIAAHIDVLALTNSDNGAQYASVAFDASLMEITMMLAVGGCLTIVPNEYRLDVRKIGNFYKENNISVAIFVPSSLAVLNPDDFKHLRVILSTGEPVSTTTIKRWREEGYSSGLRKFINGYGDTEGTIAWTLGECFDEVHIGEPIIGCHLYLLKKIKQEEINKFQKKQTEVSQYIIEQETPENKIKYWLICQNINEEGEIWLAGNGLTPGYLNEKLNKKAFVNDPVLGRLYRTYNVAKYDVKGQCQIVDRKGRRLKIHGQFVEPKEIDNAIEKYNSQKVAKAFVSKRIYVLPDNQEYKRYHLIAYVETRNDQKIDATELSKSLRSLPRYMVPARWVIMDKLPINNSGKIDRKKLSSDTSPFIMARLNKFTLPRDGISGYEKQIHDIWGRLLGLKENEISIYDDFFYLGGDSLLFMQMIDLLKEEFSNKDLKQFQTISASTLALNPTIAAISRFIRLDEQHFDFIDYSLKRENGDKSPLILIPPITGDLGDAYSKFVEKIPIDRPVVGLKYPGHQNILNMYDTVEEHARDCSEAIISFRNKRNISGPILLFGYSSGGIIAYEIAKILIAKNYKVYAFICDSIAPDFYKRADQNQIKIISDNLLHRLINYFSVDPKKVVDATHKAGESNYEFMSQELDRLLPQIRLQRHREKLEFIKKVKLAEINYYQNPVEDMPNDSKIILLTADKTIENAGGDNNLYWSNCINATVKYEADHDNILEKITSDRSFHELLEEADNKILYTWNIPSLAPGYIPRVELTSEIKTFFSGKGFEKSVFCALSGPSGCGKTMLAINIINASTQYLQRLYFNASSTHQLKTELLNFAKKQNFSNITEKNIFHHIQSWLKEHPGGFLVLDNCNKEKLIDFIPSSGWHVLITTNLSNLKIHTIPINGMKEHEANKLLSVACINIDQSNRLAKLANYQPLYLRLICAYLWSYQNEAQTKAHELIRNCEIKNLSQKQIIFEISKLAFSRFQTLNYHAMQLLHELAYFNGSKISHLLVKLLIASGDTIKENNQFLLITNFLKENDLLQEMGSESFYIHPELQELLKKEAEAKNIKTTSMALLNTIDNHDSLSLQTQALSNIHLISICQKLISLYPFEKTERCYYEFCKQLKPHIKVLLNYAKSDNLYQVKMLRMLADSYQANGNHFKQICSIKKAKDMVESEHYKKLKNDYEGNIQKALVYKDFVLSRLSIAEQFRYINLLNDAKKIFESFFNNFSGSDEVAKIEVQLHYILTQMGVIQRDISIEYINYLLNILPWESFERAAVLKRVFSIFPKYKQDKVLQAACTIYENYDAAHPDLPLIYKQLYIMQKSKGSGQTQFLEKAIDIIVEVSEFCHINIDILSIFTLLINDYYTTYTDRNLQDIGVKIDKANNYVKFFKYLVKKLQNNLLHFTQNDSIKPLLPKLLYQEEKLKYHETKFHNHESVKKNIYNQSFLEVIKNIQEYCFTILGLPPCEFVIVVLGSFSYGLAVKGSDFEYSVIILPGHDNIKRQFIDNYFQCYLPLFESFFKIAFANTGCHIDRGVSPHIKYDKIEKKYKIKGFYGTPDDILDRHCRLSSNNSNKEGTSKVSLYQLLNPQYLTGNQALYQNFLSNLHQRLQSYINHEPFYRAYAKEQLELHCKEYTEAYKAYYEQLKSVDISLPLVGAEKQVYLTKVKKLIAHPLVFIVFDIALHSNILIQNRKIYKSIFELISRLRSESILSEQLCYALEATLCDVTIIRNKINDENYNGVSLINDNKVLLRICDEVLSEFAKNKERFIDSQLSDEGSDEQYEEDYYEDRYEHYGSPSILERTSQRDSHRNTSLIEMKSDKPATLVYEIDFPSLSIYRRNEYYADNDQRQIATMQLSTPIKNVNTSLDQSTDSPSDISPSIIKKAGIEELIYDEDEIYSSDEDSYQEDDDDEIWSNDNDAADKWEINDDDLYLKLKNHKKYQEQFEGSAKQRFKGFKSKLKKIENNSVQSLSAKESLIKSQRMKMDVNNNKTTLKSKNYQKEKIKYFKKTKNFDDNLRKRVGKNRVNNVSANNSNPHKAICIFDNAPNEVEDVILFKGNSGYSYKLTQKSTNSSVSQNINRDITIFKNTSDNDSRMSLKKPKLISTFKKTKKHLQKIEYLVGSIHIEVNDKVSVYVTERQLHPRLYGLNNKKLVKRESLINNESDTIRAEFEQMYHHGIHTAYDDPTIPLPLIYFEGNKYILNPNAFEHMSKPISSLKVKSVKNINYVGAALSSHNDSINNKFTNTDTSESQLSLKKSSENEVVDKQIQEQNVQLSITNPASSSISVVAAITPSTSMKRVLFSEMNVGPYFLKRPPISTLLGMLEDDPDYLELLFEKNTTALSNNYISRIFHNSIFSYTYSSVYRDYLDSSLRRNHNYKITINNTVVLSDEFFLNLNHYIVGYRILNLSNLSLVDDDITHLADNLRTNTTLLYLQLDLSYLSMNSIEYLSRVVLSNNTLLAIRFEKPLMMYDELFLNHPAINAIKVSLYLNNYIRLNYIEQRLKQIFDNYSEGKDIDLSNLMLCDDGAKQLAKYLMKFDCIIPKLNLEHNYITSRGWGYIFYALFNYFTQELRCSNIIFEQGNFDVYFPKNFFNDKGSIDPYLLSDYGKYRFTDGYNLTFGRSRDIGQRNFNWDCISDTLSLTPRVEFFPESYYSLNFPRASLFFPSSLFQDVLVDYVIPVDNNLVNLGGLSIGNNFVNLVRLSIENSFVNLVKPTKVILAVESTATDKETHTFNQRLYQKNMRATFFYNTSGRKAEHQHRHAPTKPNTRTRKGC